MLLDYQVSQTSRKFASFQDFLQLTLAALCLRCSVDFLQLWRAEATLQWECVGSSLQRLLSLWSTGSGARGLSSCGSWVLELGIRSCGAWVLLLCGMWDLLGEGLNPCPCAGRQILNHWTPREVLDPFSFEQGIKQNDLGFPGLL